MLFDLFASATQAYQQVGLFLGALFCLGLGGLLLGNALYWRVHALRASGTIIGVIASGNIYTPVYRYTLPDGQSHEAKSDTGSSSVAGKETGRTVKLLISAHDPTAARPADSYLFDILGAVLLLPGAILAYVAIADYPVTLMTWIMAAALILYLVMHGRRILIPKADRVSLAEWRKQRGLGAAGVDLAQVKRIEEIVPSAQLQQQAATQRQQMRKWAPFIALFAMGLAGLAVWQGMRLAHLEAVGLRAPGEVVSLKGEWSSGSGSSSSHYTYYPIVQFRTPDHARIEFKDSIGSNPPSHRPGDKVTVLYLAENPGGAAMIDRGLFWNWAIPAAIFAAALVLAGILIGMLRRLPAPSPAT
jgi:hypothetical protein